MPKNKEETTSFFLIVLITRFLLISRFTFLILIFTFLFSRIIFLIFFHFLPPTSIMNQTEKKIHELNNKYWQNNLVKISVFR